MEVVYIKQSDRAYLSIDDLHKLKELEQEKFLLTELNKYLGKKVKKFEKSDRSGKIIGDTFYTLKEVEKKINQAILKSESLEKKLKKSIGIITYNERKYKSLYEDSPLLLRTINKRGIIIDCNELYAKSLGYLKKDVRGRSIFAHTAKRSLDDLKKSFNAWKCKGIVKNREIWLKKKDGTTFPTLLSASNLYGKNGKLIGSNTAIRPITEIYEAQKKLKENEAHIKEQFEKLKELDKSKDEFLAMITHELKTPLVPIKGYVDILLSENLGPLNNQQKERMQIIKSSTNSLLKLVSDLLDVQKIELGQLKLNKKMYNLSQIIHEVINQIKPTVDRKGITIILDLKPNISCMCDNTRIAQVLNNLILNSIDFSPAQNGKVIIKSYVKNGHANIIVKDNGIGIVKSSLEKIFVKFYQIDTSTTREHGGTGLGLSVCKGIVETHMGKIWAESEGRNKGTTMHVMLPIS